MVGYCIPKTSSLWVRLPLAVYWGRPPPGCPRRGAGGDLCAFVLQICAGN